MPSQEGKRIPTVDICERMEKKYGHVYNIFDMENYLLELTKQTGLKQAGKTIVKKDTPEKLPNKPIFMPIKPDKYGICRTTIWDV